MDLLNILTRAQIVIVAALAGALGNDYPVWAMVAFLCAIGLTFVWFEVKK